MLAAQCQSLIEAWHYAPTDHVLHVLPLNHIHGLMNGLLAPLYAGCSIEFLRHSDLSMAEAIWCRLAARFIRHDQRAYIDTNHIEHVRKDSVASDTGDPARVRPSCASKTFRGRAISVFTAVPTIYKNMLEAFPRLDPTTQDAAKEAIKPENLRLPMSGSAPLPRNIQAQWAELSQGSMILERYGMTETGMILSCGLEASSKIVGSVGWPLPSVSVRLVSGGGDGEIIEQAEHDTPDTGRREGEIQVHGNGIFAGYHGDHKRENDWKVDPDGVRWFRTGDIAYRDPSLIRLNGSTNADSAEPWIKGSPYIILGRLSMDIIKSGGEKISALEVETAIYSVLEDISEVAVLGVPSERWGQRLAAVIVMKRSKTDSEREAGQIRKVRALEITRQLSSVLSKEKIPRLWKSVPAIPRNAMGKVNKSELGRLLWPGRYAGADAPLD